MESFLCPWWQQKSENSETTFMKVNVYSLLAITRRDIEDLRTHRKEKVKTEKFSEGKKYNYFLDFLQKDEGAIICLVFSEGSLVPKKLTQSKSHKDLEFSL